MGFRQTHTSMLCPIHGPLPALAGGWCPSGCRFLDTIKAAWVRRRAAAADGGQRSAATAPAPPPKPRNNGLSAGVVRTIAVWLRRAGLPAAARQVSCAVLSESPTAACRQPLHALHPRGTTGPGKMSMLWSERGTTYMRPAPSVPGRGGLPSWHPPVGPSAAPRPSRANRTQRGIHKRPLHAAFRSLGATTFFICVGGPKGWGAGYQAFSRKAMQALAADPPPSRPPTPAAGDCARSLRARASVQLRPHAPAPT